MKRTMLYLMVFGLTISFMATSCKKGEAGPQGEQGEQGEKGDPGSPNVIYSAWTNANFSLDTGYIAITAPKITLDILNKGVVKVYMNLNTAASPVVVAVPYREPMATTANPTAPDWTVDAYLSNGLIELISNYPFNYNFPIRYVIVPGGVTARSGINYNNYEEVKKAFDIKD